MSSVQPEGAPKESTGSLDPSYTLEKMKDLLQAKDDTSRFVGLALLKSVLDNGQLVQDSENLRLLWETMSPKFLDRLLRAQQSEKVNKAQSKDMVDLAVAVLHTFTILLPEDSRKQKRLTGRTGPLVKAVVQRYIPQTRGFLLWSADFFSSSAESTKLILQTLLTIVSQPEGAVELLHIQDLSPLIEIASQDPLVLEIIKYTWLNASTISDEIQVVREKVDRVIPALVVVFKGTDAVTFLSFLSDLLPKLEPEVSSLIKSYIITWF
jgi:Neurochondrin